MKTIILGYADAAGVTTPKTICGPAVSAAEQWRVFHAAKNFHEYPKGIKRLEQRILAEDFEVAIFLGDEVAGAGKARREAHEAAESARKVAATADAERIAELKAAEKAITAAAADRNALLAKLNETRAKLRNAEQAQEKMPSELHQAALESAKKLIFGDPANKIAPLEEQCKAAHAAVEAAVAALKELKSKPASGTSTTGGTSSGSPQTKTPISENP